MLQELFGEDEQSKGQASLVQFQRNSLKVDLEYFGIHSRREEKYYQASLRLAKESWQHLTRDQKKA